MGPTSGASIEVRTQRKLPTVTKATLKKHTDDKWMAIHGLVYDVTKYPDGCACRPTSTV